MIGCKFLIIQGHFADKKLFFSLFFDDFDLNQHKKIWQWQYKVKKIFWVLFIRRQHTQNIQKKLKVDRLQSATCRKSAWWPSRRTAAKTASSRAPLHSLPAHCFSYTQGSLGDLFFIFSYLFIFLPFAFWNKVRSFLFPSIWFLLLFGTQLHCWVQMPPSVLLKWASLFLFHFSLACSGLKGFLCKTFHHYNN